jgi:glucose-6-phosphate isomerase
MTAADRSSVLRVSGMDIELDLRGLGFAFGPTMHAVPSEQRQLDAVRASLMDPGCDGPDLLYTIYMDFCRRADRERIVGDGLLYGGVIYAAGAMGREFVRSQGHRHTSNEHGVSYPEVYEFWHGRGLLYMQKEVGPEITDCRVMTCSPGDVAIVPPDWVHLTVNVGDEPLAFGAWCARGQGFDYEGVRRLQGTAWYFLADGSRVPNPRFTRTVEPVRQPMRDYPEFDIVQKRPVYEQYLERPERLRFMSHPHEFMDDWASLERRP